MSTYCYFGAYQCLQKPNGFFYYYPKGNSEKKLICEDCYYDHINSENVPNIQKLWFINLEPREPS
jgi:hypothetical protein